MNRLDGWEDIGVLVTMAFLIGMLWSLWVIRATTLETPRMSLMVSGELRPIGARIS